MGDPCGIPVVTVKEFVTFEFIASVVLRSIRKLSTQRSIQSGIRR